MKQQYKGKRSVFKDLKPRQKKRSFMDIFKRNPFKQHDRNYISRGGVFQPPWKSSAVAKANMTNDMMCHPHKY